MGVSVIYNSREKRHVHSDVMDDDNSTYLESHHGRPFQRTSNPAWKRVEYVWRTVGRTIVVRTNKGSICAGPTDVDGPYLSIDRTAQRRSEK